MTGGKKKEKRMSGVANEVNEAAMVDVRSFSFFGSGQGGEDEESEHQRDVLEIKPERPELRQVRQVQEENSKTLGRRTLS